MVEAVEAGASLIRKCMEESLQNKQGCLIGRFGTIEFDVVNSYASGHVPSEQKRMILERHAGIFPNSVESVKGWANAMEEAVKQSDILATGWYAPIVQKEQTYLKHISWNGSQVPLRSLEPYYVDKGKRWTELLTKVCAVTSFTKTASRQVQKGEGVVWPGENGTLWPSHAEWHWVQTGYAPVLANGSAEWQPTVQSWESAVEQTVEKVLATGAEIVLLGCGGLGMILGERLKREGKCCIVMGGAIQVLFGIKGERWKTHPILSKFWNDAWAWPSEEETPKNASLIEGSCYWKPLDPLL